MPTYARRVDFPILLVTVQSTIVGFVGLITKVELTSVLVMEARLGSYVLCHGACMVPIIITQVLKSHVNKHRATGSAFRGYAEPKTLILGAIRNKQHLNHPQT